MANACIRLEWSGQQEAFPEILREGFAKRANGLSKFCNRFLLRSINTSKKSRDNNSNPEGLAMNLIAERIACEH
jgi:hypothetical protein